MTIARRMLWAAVLDQLEVARQAAPVRVYGPGGKSVVMPRGHAELLAQRHRLQRAPDEIMRETLGMPPRITTDASSDHTHLAGAAAAE